MTAATLASCGGSQPPVGAPGAIAQTHATHQPSSSGRSLLHVFGSYPPRSKALLYVANDYPFSVDIFPLTGPNQPQIGSITSGVSRPLGLSVDSNKSLYVANEPHLSYGWGTVTVYPYRSTAPSMTYSKVGRALYAIADSKGHVFVSGQNNWAGVGHILEFNAGRNRAIARVRLGSETDGMAVDGQDDLYVAYRGKVSGSIAEFGPDLTNRRYLGVSIDQPQGLLVDNAGNIIVVESAADRIDVFPPGAKTPSVTVAISGIGNLAELAMQNSEKTLWVSSLGGYVYSMPYPLTASTVPTEYEKITGSPQGIAVSP
jgi:hypothetical protein